MIQFPDNFLWGAATSAYQVEGGNSNCDWWQWERQAGLKEASGDACRHYQLYREDFDLAKQLNHNAHRLSVEWARIEPQKGNFSQTEIRHYIDVIDSLRMRGIEPIVTLHHFTNPAWFALEGGWLNSQAAERFLRYTNHIVSALSGKVKYWVTFNEPMVYLYQSFILGLWPPQEKSFLKALRVASTLSAAHTKAYHLIRGIYRKQGLEPPLISIANNMQSFMPCRPNFRNRVAASLRNKIYNFSFLDRLWRKKTLDFIGLNYYTRGLVDVKKWRLRNLLMDNCLHPGHGLKKNSLGWDIYPQGLYDLLVKLRKYGLTVIILENGICTEDDKLRWDFIDGHLRSVHRAICAGVKVSGYLYWSLLDNFEWDKGFGHRFGLIKVDYSDYKRTVRESAKKLAEVAGRNRLE